MPDPCRFRSMGQYEPTDVGFLVKGETMRTSAATTKPSEAPSDSILYCRSLHQVVLAYIYMYIFLNSSNVLLNVILHIIYCMLHNGLHIRCIL